MKNDQSKETSLPFFLNVFLKSIYFNTVQCKTIYLERSKQLVKAACRPQGIISPSNIYCTTKSTRSEKSQPAICSQKATIRAG